MSESEFAIVGAGAIGSILAAHLARAGHSVVLLARGRRAAQIEGQGIRISGLTEFCSRVQVVRDPSRLRGDVLIVAVKGPDTREVLEHLRRDAASVAFSIQNGLEKNELLAAAFGGEHVLGALANTSGEILPTGEVAFTRNANISLGEMGGGPSERAARIASMIDHSGVRARSVDNIIALEWSKMCAWAGLMAMSVTTRAATWKYLRDPDSARLIALLVRELGTIARGLGIELSDDSVLPVATMCAQDESSATRAVMQAGAEFEATTPEHRMSSLQDLNAGRPLEIDSTLGYANRQAVRLGLSLPLLATFLELTSAIDRMQGAPQA